MKGAEADFATEYNVHFLRSINLQIICLIFYLKGSRGRPSLRAVWVCYRDSRKCVYGLEATRSEILFIVYSVPWKPFLVCSRKAHSEEIPQPKFLVVELASLPSARSLMNQ
jgi:hypothetical protein